MHDFILELFKLNLVGFIKMTFQLKLKLVKKSMTAEIKYQRSKNWKKRRDIFKQLEMIF